MKRRKFLKLLGSSSLAAGAGLLPSARGLAAQARDPIPGNRVAIFGGGVAGLSAAHELAERGFEVSVFESKPVPGGKARSIGVPGTAQGGRRDLPGEHGFRFVPAFYKHLPDTMSRIPLERGGAVSDNLVATSRILLSRAGMPDVLLNARFPVDTTDVRTIVRSVFGSRLGVPASELEHFALCLNKFLCSCDERRLKDYERVTWWDFVGAGERSAEYQKYLATGLCRSLVAMKPKTASARTVGTILCQLLFAFVDPLVKPDRVLNGPTSEVWIDPWVRYLESLGSEIRFGAKLVALDCGPQGVRSASIELDGRTERVEADFYLCAVPVEVFARVLDASGSGLLSADPALEGVRELNTEWMNGIQFFLNEDAPIANGHAIYIDSPWALTSISQRQFWTPGRLASYGDGQLGGILSVDISDWSAPGILYGKPARECTAQEICDEVWAQLKAHLNDTGAPLLEDRHRAGWFLDPAIGFAQPGLATNDEPLLVNTVGSWLNRPTAATRVPNLFLASDYVRTTSDLACMESANEAARRATNAILDAAGSDARRCDLWDLKEPLVFWPAKKLDQRVNFPLGLPAPG